MDGSVGKPIIWSVRQVNHAWAIAALGSYLIGLLSHPCLNLRAIAARCVKSQGDLAGKKVPAQAIGA